MKHRVKTTNLANVSFKKTDVTGIRQLHDTAIKLSPLQADSENIFPFQPKTTAYITNISSVK